MTTAQLVADEQNFRPKKLDDFIGQADVKKTLSLRLSSAQKHGSVRRGPGPYPVMFEALQTGPCTLTDGDFSVQLIIK
jgi:hypothetical protein